MSHISHCPSDLLYSKAEWMGSQPKRFTGGRSHNNHPADELDNLLLGHQSTHAKILGPSKRKFENKTTIGTDNQPKPHIRANAMRNQSSIQFGHQHIPKLIKISKESEPNVNMSSVYRQSKTGESKIKNLQNGRLQIGIYRNFYKGIQAKQYQTIA